MEKAVLSLVVENHANVLARVASLFSRRGFNIDSLTVSATNDPEVSRITIVTQGDAQVLKQIIQQTDKLIETKMIFSVESEFCMIRELLLVKFSTVGEDPDDIDALKKIIGAYGATVIDLSTGSFVAELSATSQKIDEFLEATKEYEKLELCRSGAIAMERGDVSYDIN